MFSIQKLLCFIFIVSFNALGSETIKPIHSMLPFPVMVDFSGNVTWGYPLSSDSMHSGHMDMGSSDMDMGSSVMDMGSSDMDMGEMNSEDQMDHSNTTMNHSSGWHFMVMPMLSLGTDTYRRVISKSSADKIELSNESKGYYAIENKTSMYGGGAGIMAMPPNGIPLLSLRLSLMPYKGGHVFKLKQIANKNEVNQLNSMLIPQNKNELDSWSTGDRMSYSARGGVMFGAGVGYTIFAAVMGTYMAEGSWNVSVSKADDTTVYIEVKKEKMNMMSRKVMNALIELSGSEMKSISSNFQFLFDLAYPLAQEAYDRLLNGDILFAQELAKEYNSGVEIVRSSHTLSNGRMRARSFGIPWLYNRERMSSKMTSDSIVYQGFNGQEFMSYMAMYRDAVRSEGRMSYRVNSGVLFMGMTNHETENLNDIRTGGVFKWFFHKENTSKNYLKWQLNRLIHKFGLDQAKSIDLTHYKSGFVSAELDLSLTHDDLMKLIESNTNAIIQEKVVTKELNSYFSSEENVRIHCGTKTVKKCMRRLYKNTHFAVSQLPMVIKNLSVSFKRKTLKDYNLALGQLGRLALTNRFVLSKISEMAGKNILSGVLKLKGSDISQVQIQL